MGMSTHVVGFKPPDVKWTQRKVIWEACRLAGIERPTEVTRFFEGEAPDPAGVRVEIEKGPAVQVYEEDGRSGFEVDVKKLDPDVTIIRFYNAW